MLGISGIWRKGMSILLEFGSFGGFYIRKGYGVTVCVGWISLSVWPIELTKALRGKIGERND
jgi:hypothetical protein